jgi:acyl carrier protein
MDSNEVEARLFSFIEKTLLGGNAEGLDRATALLELGVVDSMGITRLTSFLEAEFGLRVPVEELSAVNFGSIEAIARLVLKLSA